MIIFDLDGTLADCQHRRHLVDPVFPRPGGEDYALSLYSPDLNAEYFHKYANGKRGFFYHKTNKRWEPDWKSFYESCDIDKPIDPVIELLKKFIKEERRVQIWSGRCESVREKTEEWLEKHISINLLYCFGGYNSLKMRPIGDYTPDDVLKEKWLDETLSQGKKIDFVFDDRPKVIRMWRRRGIFVFNCCQTDEEF